ncbi:MAG: acetyl-CoA C-acyltransferase, partial [Desulfobacterales bacterium]
MHLDDVVIVGAARSPIGTYGGQFREVTGVPLGIPVMQEIIRRANIDPAAIDEVGWGCCYQRAKDEVNIGRVTA